MPQDRTSIIHLESAHPARLFPVPSFPGIADTVMRWRSGAPVWGGRRLIPNAKEV